ncbi:MAG: MarR family transcriptional regulator [Dehalococcoidia bacterium]
MADAVDQLTGNIRATVATAEAVLAHFEQSLRDAGFADNAQSYTQLAETLIGQRLWAESSGIAADARFEAVAVHARAIHALLLPYVEAFYRMAALGAPSLLEQSAPETASEREANAAPSTLDDPLAARILEALARAERPLSVTALRAELQVPKSELVGGLDRLSASGHIERRRVAGREHVTRARQS